MKRCRLVDDGNEEIVDTNNNVDANLGHDWTQAAP